MCISETNLTDSLDILVYCFTICNIICDRFVAI